MPDMITRGSQNEHISCDDLLATLSRFKVFNFHTWTERSSTRCCRTHLIHVLSFTHTVGKMFCFTVTREA